MRIAFITSEFVTEPKTFDGGLANYLFRTALALIDNGNNVEIFVTSDKNETLTHHSILVHRVKYNPNQKLIKLLQAVTFHLYDLTISYLYQSYCLQKALLKVHKKSPFDIAQFASYLAVGFFRPRNIPSVIRISSYQPGLREAYGNKTPSKDILMSEKLEIIAMKKADAVYGPSDLTARLLKSQINKEIEVIENAFEIDQFEDDLSIYNKVFKNKKYLLFFGSVGTLKGVGTISRVIYDILKLDKDLYFGFVGKNMNNMVEELKKNARELENKILYFDRLSHSQLYPIISGSYAVVLPSLIDNFPNTCIEAMALSKVVIGTKGTSFEQLIEQGENGFLIEIDNAKELVNTIRQILNMNPEALALLGNNAKKRIDLISSEKQIPKLISFYNRVINSQK